MYDGCNKKFFLLGGLFFVFVNLRGEGCSVLL